jgi:hypothetical protein
VVRDSSHSKVHALFHLAESDPAKAATCFDFRILPKENRSDLIKTLPIINKRIADLSPRKVKAPPVMLIEPDDIKSSLHQTSRIVRDRFERIYDIVAENWKCSNHNPHTDAKLRLRTYRKSGKDIDFDILFTAASMDKDGKRKIRFQQSTLLSRLDETVEK